MPGPISPADYDPDDPYTEERAKEDGYATGLRVWGQVTKAYERYLYGTPGSDAPSGLANTQLWSLRQAIRAEVFDELGHPGFDD